MQQLTIGKLALQAGVTKVSIRYYERCGLIPKAHRLTSGYRVYPTTTVARIRFLKNAQSVGFSLHEISDLLTPDTSQDVRALALTKHNAIQNKLNSLQAIANTLHSLTAACDGEMPLQDCPILKALSGNPIALEKQ